MKKVPVRLSVFLLVLAGSLLAIPPLSIEQVENGYRIQFEVPDPLIMKEQVNTVSSDGLPVNELFVKAFIYGFDYDGALGEPAQLTGSFNLAYEGDAPVVEVESVVTKTIPIEGKLYPIQPPSFYDGSNTTPPFTYHPESYERVVRGTPASVSELFTYRGQKAAEISVQPLSYDPETNTVTIIKKLSMKVTMKKPVVVRSLGSRDFDQVMRAQFANLEGVPSEAFAAREKYLIIADPAYLNNADLKRFVDYRSTQYDVKLVSTADVGGTTKEAYRDFIYNREKPTFCLLVGNTVFPYWTTNDWNSLIYYVATQITSTSQKPRPSIALGLFYVTSAAQITNIVNKTIATESALATRTKVVLGQGGNTQVMGSLPADHCDKIIVEVNTKYFPSSTGFQVFNYASISGGAQRAIDRFNLGCWFNIYNGHGSTSSQAFGWGTSNLTSMRNTVYPFVLTCACQTGTFNRNCVAAASVAHQYGPVTYIGSNLNSSIGQHVLNQGYPDAIMARKITKNGLAFVYGVNYDSTPRAVSQYSGQVSTGLKARMGWQYHHFGDPAIETIQSGPVTPFIDVTAPARGDQWEHGSAQKILWSDNISGNVKIDLYKGTSLNTVIAASSASGGTHDWTVPATLAAGSDYKIRVTSVDSAALWDTSGMFGIVAEYIITPPYLQNFETLDSGSIVMPLKYAQSTADDIDWLVWKGPTPSRIGTSRDTTGPMGDHTSGTGKYIYVEASNPNNPAKRAEFVTPNFNLRASGLRLSFWVHMMSLNNTMGSLTLDICVDGTWRTGVMTITGNQGMEWQQRILDLAQYAGDRVSFRFRGTTGTTWASDICLDDIRIDLSTGTFVPAAQTKGYRGITLRGSTVAFHVPENASAQPVTVSLLDPQGRTVRTIANKRFAGGSHVLP
ncbi:MAG: hypothetical protein JXA71_03305, partial [Chitinispirillaceae bacterium]|nr:hypothetical protein [Chitinispirillaceae bacterium]